MEFGLHITTETGNIIMRLGLRLEKQLTSIGYILLSMVCSDPEVESRPQCKWNWAKVNPAPSRPPPLIVTLRSAILTWTTKWWTLSNWTFLNVVILNFATNYLKVFDRKRLLVIVRSRGGFWGKGGCEGGVRPTFSTKVKKVAWKMTWNFRH